MVTLLKVVPLCLFALLCMAIIGCGPKEIEPVVEAAPAGLSQSPEGVGMLDARLFYIKSKYGLSSEDAQAKMDALYEDSGFTDVVWDNYRKWLETQDEDIRQAYEKAKKAELTRLRTEGME